MNTIVRGTSLCVLLVVSTQALAAENSVAPTISVTGTAVTRVAPDIVLWQIDIRESGEALLPAKKRCDAKVKAILALAPELGVAPEDVQTGSLDIRREYKPDLLGRTMTFKEFVVEQPITLRQRDLARFDEFISKLLATGDMEVRFRSESSRALELRAETRVKAVRIAREKAEVMCREAGGAVGRPLRIEESTAGALWSSPMNAATNVQVTAESNETPDFTDGTFAPGAIEIRVSVCVDFAID